MLALINTELFKLAPLISYKGFDANLPLPGFKQVIGLPVPVLTVTPDYWAELKHKVRTDLKRKLKGAASLRFEEVDGLPEAHVARVHALYRQTCDNADIQFEQLPPAYFRETGPLSKYIFYFEGEQMLGFHQLMCDGDTMYCKYIGMDYAKAHEHKLYFALMLQAVNICIRDGIRHVDFGVTSYAFKRQLGCEMHPSHNYFMHRKGRVISQSDLIEHLYPHEAERDPNTIEVYVARLRRKLGRDAIKTLRYSFWQWGIFLQVEDIEFRIEPPLFGREKVLKWIEDAGWPLERAK